MNDGNDAFVDALQVLIRACAQFALVANARYAASHPESAEAYASLFVHGKGAPEITIRPCNAAGVSAVEMGFRVGDDLHPMLTCDPTAQSVKLH